MDYRQAMDFINSTLKFGSKLGLENINFMLKLLGNPHEKLRVIHVGGTNGKGSISVMIASILKAQGYRVGLFTSPCLESFTERIQINGEPIKEEDVARLTGRVKEKIDQMVGLGYSHPTEFEIVTAIGFMYFFEQAVDFAVVEVGLGGRLDATNVVHPLISVIASISLDHMDVLGNSIEKIAYEKAGIIKEGVPVVSYPQRAEALKVIAEVCRQKNSPLIIIEENNIKIRSYGIEGQCFDFERNELVLDNLRINLLGRYQVLNAAVAVTAMVVLMDLGVTVYKEALYDGLRFARWPGRVEVLPVKPLVVIDGAHNEQGMMALKDVVCDIFNDREIILVLGVLRDKEVEKMVDHVVPLAHRIICTQPDNSRAMDAEKLSELINNRLNRRCIPIKGIGDAIDRALDLAMDTKDAMVLISGSLYLVGPARSKLIKRKIENR
ncbi:MAG: bifunctional folylpolyglutamate synthase/dihydrofolate synthase [Mahellales bacterium]